MHALQIRDLKKTYEGGMQALKGISLNIEKGDFFALLGPNGAGKSTTIGIITHLVNKTSGKVSIYGHDIDEDFSTAKTFVGVVPQEFNCNIFETPFDIIVQQAGYYGMPRAEAKRRTEKVLKQLELWDKRNVRSMALSGGMKRRLMIARALVHKPKLLILDEPTAGVDIEIRRSMWKFMQDINKQGVTIILTTHYLEEAENLCRNIGIIHNGELVENTSMKTLLNKLHQETFILDTKDPVKKLPRCKGLTQIDDTTLEVVVTKKQNLNKIFEILSKNNIVVSSLRNKSNRLEELFVGLVK